MSGVIATLALVLAASGPVRLAAPGVSVHGVDAALADGWLDRFVTQLGKGVVVTTRHDVEQLLGLERQRELLGCTDSGCSAELMGALGVDAVLSGSVLKSESGYTVTLRVIGSGTGRELTTATGRFASEKELLDWLDATAPKMAEQLTLTLGRGPAPESRLGWKITAVAGGAALVAGVLELIFSRVLAGQLMQPGSFTSAMQIDQTANTGKALQTSGGVVFSLGLAALAAGILWAVLQ